MQTKNHLSALVGMKICPSESEPCTNMYLEYSLDSFFFFFYGLVWTKNHLSALVGMKVCPSESEPCINMYLEYSLDSFFFSN